MLSKTSDEGDLNTFCGNRVVTGAPAVVIVIANPVSIRSTSKNIIMTYDIFFDERDLWTEY